MYGGEKPLAPGAKSFKWKPLKPTYLENVDHRILRRVLLRHGQGSIKRWILWAGIQPRVQSSRPERSEAF